MSLAFVGIIGSSLISGIVVLLITQAVYVNVPDQSDIARMILDDVAKMKSCGDNPTCKNTVQSELNTLDWYQKANSAKATGQIFGIFLIIGLPSIGLVAAFKQ